MILEKVETTDLYIILSCIAREEALTDFFRIDCAEKLDIKVITAQHLCYFLVLGEYKRSVLKVTLNYSSYKLTEKREELYNEFNDFIKENYDIEVNKKQFINCLVKNREKLSYVLNTF